LRFEECFDIALPLIVQPAKDSISEVGVRLIECDFSTGCRPPTSRSIRK